VLRDLHIRNLAVVEEASIELGSGLNVLSGETGAGKSIVVDSLVLLAGARAASDLIRTDADKLHVTGVFEPSGNGWRRVLRDAGLEADDDELMVRREITRSGKNRVFVNDHPVTLKLLAELSPHLLRIHGQREELGLVAPELQRTWLDRCGGRAAEKLLARTAASFAAWRALADRYQRLTGDERVRQGQIDLLRFQLQEIDSAGLVAGEEVELRRDREVLRHAEAIQESLTLAGTLLFDQEDAAHGSLIRARTSLEQISHWEPQAGEWVTELKELDIRLGELEAAIARRRDEVEADPQRLNAIEDRLALIERLLKKYGAEGTSAAVLAHRDAVDEELAELEGDESALATLDAEARVALDAYRDIATELSQARREWAATLERRVSKDLRELALDKARFLVTFEHRARSTSPLHLAGEAVEFSELGFDQVVFNFAANPGEEPRPLARVASGGELSRLYLAVQLAAQGTSRATVVSGATLVFDEVDTGVGGAEAARLGGMLRRLAGGGQILAVTHLPQMASCADQHFKVKKHVTRGRTHTDVEALGEESRIEEVARMLAGNEVTDASLTHARELIAGATG
jgi:DNA repair protein RecN (Recombination protein N)